MKEQVKGYRSFENEDSRLSHYVIYKLLSSPGLHLNHLLSIGPGSVYGSAILCHIMTTQQKYMCKMERVECSEVRRPPQTDMTEMG